MNRPGRFAGARPAAAEWMVTLPSFGWLVVFFVVPTLMVFATAFRPIRPTGGLGDGWTLDAVKSLADPAYPAILWRTVWMSVAATLASLALAVPVAYCMARMAPARRAWTLLLIVVPFWTNFLIRVYAWQRVTHPNGWLHAVCARLGLLGGTAGPDGARIATEMLNGPGTVLLVMVYTYLPFAILPIYAAAEKFDFGLLDAARDLGATSAQAFRKVFLPGIRRGLENAALMVLIPCLGAYVIPKMMGAANAHFVGTMIAKKIENTRNLPDASALAALLMLMVFALLAAFLWLRRERRPAPRRPRTGRAPD